MTDNKKYAISKAQLAELKTASKSYIINVMSTKSGKLSIQHTLLASSQGDAITEVCNYLDPLVTPSSDDLRIPLLESGKLALLNISVPMTISIDEEDFVAKKSLRKKKSKDLLAELAGTIHFNITVVENPLAGNLIQEEQQAKWKLFVTDLTDSIKEDDEQPNVKPSVIEDLCNQTARKIMVEDDNGMKLYPSTGETFETIAQNVIHCLSIIYNDETELEFA